jgi:hypothetical protein
MGHSNRKSERRLEMKKLGKAVVLSCTLAVIMGLALPASSQARDSRNRREGHRQEKSYKGRDKGHRGNYTNRGRDHYRPRTCYSGRRARAWGWPVLGSFYVWTPGWGFGGRF